MRAPYNTTMNVYVGDFAQATPPPILAQADVPCRVVFQSEINYAIPPFSAIHHWVTYNSFSVVSPSIVTDLPNKTFTIHYWGGSVLEILDGSGRWFQVIFIQRVDTDADNYRRAMVIPYPVFV